jgi:transposase
MRKIREVLQLHYERRLSQRDIAIACGMARSTAVDYLWRAEQAKLAWPLPPALLDDELERILFPPAVAPNTPGIMPDFAYIHTELVTHKRLNLTLDQLWQEYKEAIPNGYQYSRYCDLYRLWLGKRDYCMRQSHKAGEKVFVDYGSSLQIWDKATGEPIDTHLFVAVWGASSYTYAEASLSQNLPAWCGSHVRALDYFGRAPQILVPDNLKSAIQTPCYYEPIINRTFQDLARHYGFVVMPARPVHPKDKPKVEVGVLVAKRWILAKLRKRIFFSLAELNLAIRELLEYLNTRPMRKLKQSRRELYEQLDRPAARSLPAVPYEYAEWRRARVNVDYHVEVELHYYSVPFQLLREEVDIRVTAGAIEIYRKGSRVAAHQRSFQKHGYTTLPEHMPPEHRKYLEWTPSRIIGWAEKTGPFTASLAKQIMEARAHPQQGYRACLGIMRLGRLYGTARLEAASARALRFGSLSFRAVRAILEKGLDRQAADTPSQGVLPFHDNLRGDYYYRS